MSGVTTNADELMYEKMKGTEAMRIQNKQVSVRDSIYNDSS